MLRRWAPTVRGPVIVPGELAYDPARRVWNLAVDLRPAAIVQCANVDDIARTVDFARSQNLPLAVRSGGHSQAGHGVCQGGIVLELGGLRAITVDPERRLVRVSSGARVSDVIAATEAHGLVTPMGGCPEVGVGGLTAGGGENFLMATCGAVVDNVTGAEVVTADGRVVAANPEENADLFWAIRGGGGNFGVVTWFEYRLYAISDVLSGHLLFPLARTREAMLRYRDLMREIPDELETSGGLTFLPDGPEFFIALCYSGDCAEGERVVERWRSTLKPESDNVKWSPYSADLVVPAAASVGTGVFLPELTDHVIDIFVSAVLEAPPSATAVWNDFHGAVTRVAGDATAFPLRERGFDLFISVPWEDEAARLAAGRWTLDLGRALRPLSRGVYVNNLNDEEGERVQVAYGANYPALARMKAKWDPDNFLRVNHNIRPVG